MEENKNELTNEVTEETVSPQTEPEAAEETFEAEEAVEIPVQPEASEEAYAYPTSEIQAYEEFSEEPAKSNKILKRILKGVIAAAAIVLTVILTLVLTPRIKYLWAMHLVNNGDYQEAYDILYEIGGSYKPAENELKRFVKIYEAEEVSGESEDEVQKITYKYEFKENYQKKTTEQGGTETVEELFYDKNGNIIKKIESDMYGSKITTEYEYDKDGNAVKVTASNDYAKLVSENKYDANGNCTQTEQTYSMGEQSQTQKVVIKNHSMQYVKK